jgi:hypothetical protein
MGLNPPDFNSSNFCASRWTSESGAEFLRTPSPEVLTMPQKSNESLPPQEPEEEREMAVDEDFEEEDDLEDEDEADEEDVDEE